MAVDLLSESGDGGGSGERSPFIGDGHMVIDVDVEYARKGEEKRKNLFCAYPKCELSAANA